jgi:hypothetical protein
MFHLVNTVHQKAISMQALTVGEKSSLFEQIAQISMMISISQSKQSNDSFGDVNGIFAK